MGQDIHSAGDLIRQWRRRRGLSQLDLASNAAISQRHLSFLESGRSRPSRDMVLHLGEHLGVPLRERNVMLAAAGFAPHYPHRGLAAPEMAGVRDLIQRLIDGHLPHPALAVDRHWTLIAANAAVQALLADVAPHHLSGEVNVLRLSLHPEGLAPRILNLREWRHHLLARLAYDIEVSADPALLALREELAAMPVPPATGPERFAPARESRIAVPLRLQTATGPVSFLSTTTVFGTATDIALSEITIEAFFPTNAEGSAGDG